MFVIRANVEWSNKFKNDLNSVADFHRPGQANRAVSISV